ncbi:MAG TPA: MBL fold metallo-hydrolase, partial [Clostridiaceae bacterium]
MIFCPLYSGSSGNSIFVSSEKTKLLIDAGLPGKSIESAMNHIGHTAAEVDGIFITHEHGDHVKGVGVLSRKYDIPIYTNEATWNAIRNSIGKVKDHNIKIIEQSVSINDMEIRSFGISH